MALILLHEHQQHSRTAEVYKWANGLAYEVHCLENNQKDVRTFNTEAAAEDFAEDWVLAAEKPKSKSKKNNDE